tara:strand:+ start:36866 stop:37054 length:189 start_codon:yes stop_codon:yes gene_type:complete
MINLIFLWPLNIYQLAKSIGDIKAELQDAVLIPKYSLVIGKKQPKKLLAIALGVKIKTVSPN